MPTAEELVVAIKSEGVGETRQDLEGVETAMQDTAESAGDSAEELEGFSNRFKGAMSAAVAALAIGAAGLLSQVPVLGETFAGLGAIVDALAFQMDGVLRPAMSGLTTDLFGLANAIFEADDGMGNLIGTLGVVGALAGIAVAALLAMGVTITGPILAAIALVAAAVAALWLAWQTNFGNIRGITNETIGNITERFKSFVKTMRPFVNSFVSFFLGLWNKWGDEIMGIVNFAMRNIAAVVESAIDIILSSFEFWAQLLTGDFTAAWNTITDLWGRLGEIWAPLINDFVDVVVGFFVDLASDLTEWATGLAEDAYNWGVDLIQGLLDGMMSLAESVVKAMENVVNSMIDTINKTIDKLPSEVRSRLGIEKFGNVSFDTNLNEGVDRGDRGGNPSPGAGRGGDQFRSRGQGASMIDGRQLSESTGRYRSDPGRRRGL